MNRRVHYSALLALVALLLGAFAASSALGAKHKPRPNLVVTQLSNPPRSIGRSFSSSAL